MNKVLLIDDEILSIEYLKSLSAWEKFGCKITGYALTVTKALELFKREKPEIVFVDIRMPKMDGLELSRKLLDIFSDTNIVIMTAYQEFEYVKEAIQIGISYFLVKHEINEDKLAEVLKKIGENISSKAHYEKVMWNDWLRTIWEDEKTENKGLTTNQWINPSATYIFVMLNLRSYAVFLGKEEKVYLKEDDFHDISSAKVVIKAFARLEKYTYGIILEYKRPSALSLFHKDMLDFSGELERRSRISVKKQAVCYFSDFLCRDSDFLDVCRRLKKVSPCFLWERKTFLMAADCRELKELIPDDLYGKKCGLLERGKDITGWLDRGKNQNWYIGAENIKFYRSLAEELNAGDFLEKIDNEMPVASIEQFLKVCQLFLEKEEGKNLAADKTGDDKAEKAVRYIMCHYAEDLSSTIIAEKLHISDGYLRYLFKRRYSCTVKEYILNYRIDMAKKLLDDNNCKIYEAAKQCGFISSQHFCRVFHQLTGISPGEYKSNKNRNQITAMNGKRTEGTAK